MVATFCPLYLRAAHRTENYTVDAFANTTKICFHRRLTTCKIPVPLFAATETNGLGASWTFQLPRIHTLGLYVAITICFCTKSHECITLKLAFGLKIFILREYFRLISLKYLLQVIVGYFVFAAELEAV